MQNPEATRVAGFNAWKKLGRSVMKGERGIAILAPMLLKQKDSANGDGAEDGEGKKSLRFRIVYVFDVAQTEGEHLPQSPANKLSGDDDAALVAWDHLHAFAVANAIPVTLTTEGLSEGSNGAYLRTTREIRILPSNPPLQRAKTLAHELGHALLHADATDSHERPIMEVEAESVAYIVMNHLGFDTGDYTFGYVALWSQEKDLDAVLRSSGARIAAATKRIITSFTLPGAGDEEHSHKEGNDERLAA
jgi:antirestriction protein ArdC